MTLKRIRLELARNPEFPEGSPERGYDLIAPLTESGSLSAAEWRKTRDQCVVARFWADQNTTIGKLVRRPGGSWAFDYDPARSSDDELGFRLNQHSFIPGEYVSFRESSGLLHTFRVASIEAVA